MQQEAKSGVFGTAQLRSYTYWLTLVITSEVIAYIYYDTGAQGPHALSAAFGIPNGFWIWASLVAAWLVTSVNVGFVAGLYTQFTGRHYVDDRWGYAKAGGADICYWSTFFALLITFYVFARLIPIGALGIFRPYIALLVFCIVARVLLEVGARSIFSALYRSSIRPVIGDGRLHCQHLYIAMRRCHHVVYQDSEWCRWHKILHEFRADNSRLGNWIAVTHMIGTGIDMSIAIVAFWFFTRTHNVIWLPLVSFSFGWACMLFADGIMAQDYPLSQFATWAKLLMVGMVLAIIGGVLTIAYAFTQPEAVLPLVTLLVGQNFPWLTVYGPTLLILFVAIATSMPVTLLVHRVMFLRAKYLSPALSFLVIAVVSLAVRQLLEKINPFHLYSPDATIKYWEVLLGNNIWWPLAIAYFLAFSTCELINATIRSR